MSTITKHDVVYAGGEKTIHYLAAGPVNGPLIMFIHGWPATAITWKTHIDTFASLGFRAIAPDMPGYGNSTARRVVEDYCLEKLTQGMMALLSDTGRDAAVWVGHDWGAGVTSSVAAQYPEAVKALVNICVPYNTIERGWEGLLPTVNREIYPADDYEFGQWDYMKKYEEDFDETVEWMDQDIAGFCKAITQISDQPPNRIAPVSTVRKSGWFNGMPKPPSVDETGPSALSPEIFDIFVQGMQKTGFWPGSAYYNNHKRNAEYNRKAPRGGRLTQPVMFMHAAWDVICDTKTSRFPEPMREVCSNLTEITMEAGHWVQFEKPGEVTAALCRFIIEELPTEWPGFWDSRYTKKKDL